MSAKFILVYNKDRDPIFVDVVNGDAMWILPSSDSLSNLLFTSHLTETGQPYYEDLKNGGVTWTLPAISKAAGAAVMFLQENTRATIEQRIGSRFSFEASSAQVRAVDEYLAYQDELKDNGVPDDNDVGSDDEIQRDSIFAEEIRPSKAVIIRTVQNIKNMKVKVSRVVIVSAIVSIISLLWFVFCDFIISDWIFEQASHPIRPKLEATFLHSHSTKHCILRK